MYNILIVDEEPMMIQLLIKLMLSSGLNIGHIYTTSSGKEALTYARECHIDLLISDVHTRDLSGIELMQQIRMLQPDIQLIVISVHEQFEYAQTAIRLGVRSYLIKPLNSEQFLDCIREVLIHLDKPAVSEQRTGQPVYTIPAHSARFKMERLPERQYELLNRLLTGSIHTEEQELLQQYLPLKGPYYAMLKMNFAGIPFTGQPDEYRWLCYAIWNVTEELLEVEDQENTLIFESGDKELSVIFQWRETDAADRMSHIIRQLEALGQSLHFHIHKFLRIPCVIGISQILRGIHFLRQLNIQTDRAIELHQEYQEHYVFYYGKYHWKTIRSVEEAETECLRNNLIVSQVKSYIDNHYNQKGLTIHEVARKNHVSPNYLSYLFKKYTGFKLWEYVIKLRMEESRELLMSTDLRRYEVADKVGYESPEHFSKIFKKYYGISPSEFKQLQT
ncbi:helix-turn-helix domain-containing protein [Paenibacillus dauci]|uniref:helix-turn-helix domain-containing protein n=1 Tax=Paenibacillus dauci TaxID=1567106 RepID=UPI0006191E84|nr:helix-turn-helix domain-containing protein [Paenibacillus dauci]